ncbi:penicillin acylase family protein [Paraconexibacter sp.]|uniref:penicillin acylase family protein n=1 Tax=Paraconexibacter sp. TaxID=2949640 RepID=UPI003565260E
MGCRFLLAAATFAALTSAAPAGAAVLRAEGVLPPGQSGFVSLGGLVDGTGSPHLYDQNQLFIDFKRKPLTFQIDKPVGGTESPRAGVTITRDAAGVPAVRGATEADAWFGAGYAIAQDRLFQLEAFRHATKGRLAELIGQDALEDDLVSRRDYYTEAERRRMYEDLSPALQLRIRAYRDGVNAWIDHVRLNPGDLPGEYAAVAKIPTPWTIDDSIAVGVFLARTVPSGDGNELANLRTVQQSGIRALQRVLPLRTAGRRPTIPASEGRFSQGRRRSAKEERAALKRSVAFAETLPKPTEEQAAAPARKALLDAGRMGRTGGSSMFAVRGKNGRAYLFNGPQLGFSTPELFVEVEVHWPGQDIRGVTAPGVPVIGIGHNGSVAWGFTSGLSDEDDLYAEQLVPGKPEHYMHKGQERQMECRDETFTYLKTVSALIGADAPEVGQRTERICRTVHGPVQLREGNVAYARRYAIWKRDVETIEGIAALNAARSIQDVDRAMNMVTWNENVMAVDSKGNIGYWHPGLFQQRPKGWDDRLPYPGTGEAEWPGLVDRTKTPRVINPKQGWLANWNNVPSQDWTNGDGESPERISGAFHRGSFLMDLVRRLHRDPSFEASEATIRRAGTTAQQRVLAVTRTRLRAAQRGADGEARAVLDTLLAWDGDYHETDAAGTVHPGVAIWVAFKHRAAAIALGRLGPGVARFDGRPGTSHEFDITPGAAYALRTLAVDDLRQAAVATAKELSERFGTPDPARWRDPRKMYKVGSQGAGQAPELPFFDRGTWEQVVEVGP